MQVHVHVQTLVSWNPTNIRLLILIVMLSYYYSESNTTHFMLMDLRLTLLSSRRTLTQFM
jgi:hypothetical protein